MNRTSVAYSAWWVVQCSDSSPADAQQRIHPAGEPLEDHRPRQGRKPIGEPLGAARVFEPEEGIVEALVPEAPLIELVGEPVMAVEVDLDGEREPGLQADVEETELAVQEVEVEEEALPPRRADHRPPLPRGEAKAAARLDRGEDAHQALADAIAAGDLAGALVLPHGGLEVLPGTARLLCDRVGVRPQPLRLSEHEGLELLEEHALVVEEVLHPVRVAEGQMALEEQAVETRERAGRGGGVLGDELPSQPSLPSLADGR